MLHGPARVVLGDAPSHGVFRRTLAKVGGACANDEPAQFDNNPLDADPSPFALSDQCAHRISECDLVAPTHRVRPLSAGGKGAAHVFRRIVDAFTLSGVSLVRYHRADGGLPSNVSRRMSESNV